MLRNATLLLHKIPFLPKDSYFTFLSHLFKNISSILIASFCLIKEGLFKFNFIYYENTKTLANYKIPQNPRSVYLNAESSSHLISYSYFKL